MASFANYALALTNRSGALFHQVHIVTTVYNGFLLDNAVPNVESTRIAFAFYHLANDMEVGTVAVVDRANGGGVSARAANQLPAIAIDNANNVACAADNALNINYQGVSGAHGRAISHYLDNGHRWLFDLCVAAVRHRLQPANIRTYFAMQHITIDDSGVLRDCIYYIASRHSAVFTGAINAIQDIEWGRYRLSISSLGSCFERCVTAYGQAVMTRVLTLAQFNACDHVRLNPWDPVALTAVTEGSIGVIAVALDVARTLPNGWISGMRAIREMPRVTNMRLTRLFMRITDLQAATANIDNAIDVAAALTAAGY